MNKNTQRYLNHRWRLKRAQNGICAGCAEPFLDDPNLHQTDPRYPTFDHVTPRSRGGRRNLDNGLLKHRRCNQIRGNSPPTGCDLVWLEGVRARIANVR